MLPPHLPFKLEVQFIGRERAELSMLLVDFGKEGKFPSLPCNIIFNRFKYCAGLVQRPINANKCMITSQYQMPAFTGHCLFMACNTDDFALPSRSDFETYIVFELAHPSWKQIGAAFSRIKKQYKFRYVGISAFTERFLKKYIQMHRTRRGLDREVANISGLSVQA
jgi:hypothetical protein